MKYQQGPVMTYVVKDTNSVVCTGPAMLRGAAFLSLTTGSGKIVVYDATATATGTAVLGGSVAGGTNAFTYFSVPNFGVACRTGIYLQAVTCTSGSDKIIIYYSTL